MKPTKKDGRSPRRGRPAVLIPKAVLLRWSCRHCFKTIERYMDYLPTKSSYLLECEFCRKMSFIHIVYPRTRPLQPTHRYLVSRETRKNTKLFTYFNEVKQNQVASQPRDAHTKPKQ